MHVCNTHHKMNQNASLPFQQTHTFSGSNQPGGHSYSRWILLRPPVKQFSGNARVKASVCI